MSFNPKSPRVRDDKYLAFVRTLPCCVCGRSAPSEAAHIRMGCLERGKPSAGMGQKPDDKWAVPLCSWCHREAPDAQHKGAEEEFWARYEIDPFAIAEKLYRLGAGTPTTKKPKNRSKIPSRPFPKTKRKFGQ